MSKDQGVERPKNENNYNMSAAGTVWIVVAMSAILAVVAVVSAA